MTELVMLNDTEYGGYVRLDTPLTFEQAEYYLAPVLGYAISASFGRGEGLDILGTVDGGYTWLFYNDFTKNPRKMESDTIQEWCDDSDDGKTINGMILYGSPMRRNGTRLFEASPVPFRVNVLAIGADYHTYHAVPAPAPAPVPVPVKSGFRDFVGLELKEGDRVILSNRFNGQMELGYVEESLTSWVSVRTDSGYLDAITNSQLVAKTTEH